MTVTVSEEAVATTVPQGMYPRPPPKSFAANTVSLPSMVTDSVSLLTLSKPR